jgi:threonine/homoserine/homoserine lactone efflux protein
MPRVVDPFLFALAVLTVLGTPGPTNSLLATSGGTAGIRRSLPLIPAETAGYLISILTLGLVLGPVMAASPLLALILRLAVGAFLILLAIRLWRYGGAIQHRDAVVTPRQIFVTTLLNPKAIVFALGVVPFGAGVPVWPYMLGFVAMLVAVALSWITAGALLGGLAGRHGMRGVVPRIGAAAVGSFALLIIAAPLLG